MPLRTEAPRALPESAAMTASQPQLRILTYPRDLLSKRPPPLLRPRPSRPAPDPLAQPLFLVFLPCQQQEQRVPISVAVARAVLDERVRGRVSAKRAPSNVHSIIRWPSPKSSVVHPWPTDISVNNLSLQTKRRGNSGPRLNGKALENIEASRGNLRHG